MRHFFLTPSLSRFEFCSNIFSIWSGKLHVPYYLVGGIPTPLKNMKVSWDDYSHILWKIKNVPNHQPVIYNDSSWRFCWRIFSKTLNRHQGTMYSDISSAHPRDHRTCGEHVENMWGTCGENVGKMWGKCSFICSTLSHPSHVPSHSPEEHVARAPFRTTWNGPEAHPYTSFLSISTDFLLVPSGKLT